MKNIIFIGGINGTGKTTVGKALGEKLGIPFFEGSTILMEELGIAPGDYDSLRSVSNHETKKALGNAFKRISSNGKAVITAHYVRIVPGLIETYQGDWFKYCSHLVHITTDPKIIERRIEEDEKKGLKIRKLGEYTGKRLNFLTVAEEKSLESFKECANDYDVPSIEVFNNSLIVNVVKDIAWFVTH